ncbi:carotenoid biosynthesis protein, partial [Meiothermus sp. PNK-Is4]
ALVGAVLWVGGSERVLAGSLALFGSLLALLAFWGGDLLWTARVQIGWTIALALLVGGGATSLLALPPSALALAGLLGAFLAQAVWLMENREARARLSRLLRRTRLWMVPLALSALVRVPVPLWPEGFALMSLLQMSLVTLAAVLWAWEKVGPRILLMGGAAFVLGLGVELLGSRSGFPFGLYSYASAPPPTLLGVPLIVLLGWFGMVLAAHVLAGGRPWLTGWLVVAWDLGLEALMPSQGYWVWQDPHPLWYGAPLQNYLSWFAMGAFLSWIYRNLAPELPHESGLAWAYRLEGLFLPMGLALFGLWPAALVCGVAMNALAWRGVRRATWFSRDGREVVP